jgi:Core-2/I-Branching enzyme
MSDTRRQRLAYLILVHTDPKQVYRLCSTLLLDERADIYIHVDLKSREDFSACQELSRDRIRFVSERYRVYWAGFHMVLATLALMRAAVDARVGYHHLVLLSGSDYPLKHPQAIHQDFLDSPFPQLINRINAFDSAEYYIHQVTRYHFRDAWIPLTTADKILRKLATISVRPIKRSLPEGLVPCEGSQWWVLTEECVQYLLTMVRERPELSHLYRYAMAPDEHFFHTLVQNSPFATEAAPIMPYTGKGMWKKANIHVVHPSLKKVYALDDFDELMATGKFFVRKVNTLQSTALMDKLDHSFLTNELDCVPEAMASAAR